MLIVVMLFYSALKINTIVQSGCTGVYEKMHQMIKGYFSDEHA